MLAYFVLFFVPALLALLPRRTRPHWIAVAPVFIFMVLFIGLRHHVGTDWNNYIAKQAEIATSGFGELLSAREFGFNALAWTSDHTGFWVYGTNFVVALIFVTGLFAYCRTAKEPWLALTAAMPYLVIVISMSAARQAAAIGIMLFAYSRWRTMGTVQRSAWVAAASVFHFSALFLLPIVALQSRLPLIWKVIFMPPLVAGAMYVLLSSDTWSYYETTYVSGGAGGATLESAGALAHVLLIALPGALYLLLRRRWTRLYGKDQLLFMMAVLSVLSVPGIVASSTGVDRMSLYLYAVPILVYGNLPGLARTGNTALILRLVILAAHLLILVVWLQYANNAVAHLPYDNFLFSVGRFI